MSEIRKIPLSRVIVSGDNPRQMFDENQLRELAESIRTHGLFQPIIVRPKGNYYELVVGERRLKASELIGLTEIEARIEMLDDATAMELRLIENAHREDLTNAEKGDAIYALWERFPEKYPTIKSVAEAIGMSYGTVQNWCAKSQKLSEKVRAFIARNELTERAAQELLKYDHETQNKLAEAIIKYDVRGGREGAERRFIRYYDENPNADLQKLAERAKETEMVRIPLERLSKKARNEVEQILEKRNKETEERREKARQQTVLAPRRERRKISRPVEYSSGIVLSKAEKLKEKLEELEPTDREELAKNVGERLDYLTRRVELERDVAKDKEMKELLEQWRASISSKIKEETPESFVKNLVGQLNEILSRVGAEYPDNVKEVSQKGLVRILSMNQLEELEKRLESTIVELRDFQGTIKSELFIRQSRIK